VAKKKLRSDMSVVDLLRSHVPGLRAERVVVIESGWDSLVYEVDDSWIFRFPRRSKVAARMRAEAALLPELAPTLPAPVPRLEVAVFAEVSFVGYRKLRGEPLTRGIDDPKVGAALGAFVAAIHRFPRERAVSLGIGDLDHRGELRRFVAELERRVVPLLGTADAARARSMFDGFFTRGGAHEPVLVHGDLGPEHILRQDGNLAGVLDWTDARIGDAALDLAWPLHGTGRRFSEAVANAYGADDALQERARFYHRLGPWHEVLYGLDEGRPELVDSGLEAIRDRLSG
jgi:aminoglycoside phosphotransferase (APT) family kinase protein